MAPSNWCEHLTSPNPRKTDNFVRLNPLLKVKIAEEDRSEPPKVFHDYFGSEQGSIDGRDRGSRLETRV